MTKTKTMFMHTIEGKPGRFDGEDQICYCSRRFPVLLLASLTDIRREQRRSRAFRKRNGYESAAYSHLRVEVP